MAETPVRMNGAGRNGLSHDGMSHNGVSHHEGASEKMADEDPQARAARLEREAEEIRRHLDGLLGELDRRRHAAADFTKQIGRYAVPVAVSLAAAAATVWGIVYLVRRDRARRRSLSYRAGVLSRLAAERGRLWAGRAGEFASVAGERAGDLAGRAGTRAGLLAERIGDIELPNVRKLVGRVDPRRLW